MPASQKKAMTFRVKIEKRGDLFIATSPDLKGMLVVERSGEALRNAIPAEVSDLFAASGVEVVVTEIENEDDDLEPWVAVPTEIARKLLQASG